MTSVYERNKYISALESQQYKTLIFPLAIAAWINGPEDERKLN